MYGDWYRDPWGWAEYSWLRKNPSKLDLQAAIHKVGRDYVPTHDASYHLTEIPKNRLAVRPAVIQDSLSKILYATAVASNVKVLHADLPAWVFGWR